MSLGPPRPTHLHQTESCLCGVGFPFVYVAAYPNLINAAYSTASACVMNFLSHDAVYSLYPFSTFCNRRSLVWGIRSPQQNRAAEKYESRGWTVGQFLNVEDLAVRPLELGVMVRQVGDSMCWTFELDSGARGEEWRDGPHGPCSWSVGYSLQDGSSPPSVNVRGFIKVDESRLGRLRALPAVEF